jgi:hypothetical protein
VKLRRLAQYYTSNASGENYAFLQIISSSIHQRLQRLGII